MITYKIEQLGIVLPTTMMLIALMTLLMLAQMKLVFTNYQVNNQLIEKKQAFFQLEQVAQTIAEKVKLLKQDPCIIKGMDANAVILMLKRKKTCLFTENQQPFSYLVENLGLFPCLQVVIDDVLYSTQHFRVNVLETRHSAVLQLRFATKTRLENCVNSKVKEGKLGLLSWRYLPDFVYQLE